MIKDSDALVMQVRQSLSAECIAAMKMLFRYMHKHPHSYDRFSHETFEDIEWLENNI